MDLYDVSVYAVFPGCRPVWRAGLIFAAPSAVEAVAAVASDLADSGWVHRRSLPDAVLLAAGPSVPLGSPALRVTARPVSSFPSFARPLRASVFPDPAFSLSV